MVPARRLPLSTVTLMFGVISIPLAFIRHLCSLAVVVGVLAMAFAAWGIWYTDRHPGRYAGISVRLMRTGGLAAIVGTASAIVMWILWAGNVLLR
jgi:hypothetical protein